MQWVVARVIVVQRQGNLSIAQTSVHIHKRVHSFFLQSLFYRAKHE
jgi:hypothetical protein